LGEETSARLGVFVVGAQVLCQVLNLTGEERYLDFRRT
jgi:hypothetical protein